MLAAMCMLRQIVTGYEILHAISFFRLMDLFLTYPKNSTFQTSLAFQMSVPQRFEKVIVCKNLKFGPT